LQAGAVAHANLNISQARRYSAHAVHGFTLSMGQIDRMVDVYLKYFISAAFVMGDRRWRRWLRHCATSRKVKGSIPSGVTGTFN
jgi:hypothetical protein